MRTIVTEFGTSPERLKNRVPARVRKCRTHMNSFRAIPSRCARYCLPSTGYGILRAQLWGPSLPSVPNSSTSPDWSSLWQTNRTPRLMSIPMTQISFQCGLSDSSTHSSTVWIAPKIIWDVTYEGSSSKEPRIETRSEMLTQLRGGGRIRDLQRLLCSLL